MTKKDWLSIVVMPTAVVLLASGVAIVLQDRSFRRNELFTAKLNQILDAQKTAVDLLRTVDEATRQVRADEAWIREQLRTAPELIRQDEDQYRSGEFFEASIDALKDSKVRLDGLVAISQGVDGGSAVHGAAEAYTQVLGRLLSCLHQNNDFRCADQNSGVVPAMRGVVVAHTTAANDLIRAYD